MEPGPGMFDRMSRAMADSRAGMVYSDSNGHPRIDYQLGSIRDNFDFGPVIAISTAAARQVWQAGRTRWAGPIPKASPSAERRSTQPPA